MLLDRLLNIIRPQLIDGVTFSVNTDDGSKSIGEKRNEIIAGCPSAQYISMIDDDDLVTTDYVSRIAKALEQSPDCVGLEGIWNTDGKYTKQFTHSIRYRKLIVTKTAYFRSPTHINPIKREIAVRCPFPHISHGEDAYFSKKVFPLLKTEVFLENPLYFYEYSTTNPFRVIK